MANTLPLSIKPLSSHAITICSNVYIIIYYCICTLIFVYKIRAGSPTEFAWSYIFYNVNIILGNTHHDLEDDFHNTSSFVMILAQNIICWSPCLTFRIILCFWLFESEPAESHSLPKISLTKDLIRVQRI